jgi:hypothetical protein
MQTLKALGSSDVAVNESVSCDSDAAPEAASPLLPSTRSSGSRGRPRPVPARARACAAVAEAEGEVRRLALVGDAVVVQVAARAGRDVARVLRPVSVAVVDRPATIR